MGNHVKMVGEEFMISTYLVRILFLQKVSYRKLPGKNCLNKVNMQHRNARNFKTSSYHFMQPIYCIFCHSKHLYRRCVRHAGLEIAKVTNKHYQSVISALPELSKWNSCTIR